MQKYIDNNVKIYLENYKNSPNQNSKIFKPYLDKNKSSVNKTYQNGFINNQSLKIMLSFGAFENFTKKFELHNYSLNTFKTINKSIKKDKMTYFTNCLKQNSFKFKTLCMNNNKFKVQISPNKPFNNNLSKKMCLMTIPSGEKNFKTKLNINGHGNLFSTRNNFYKRQNLKNLIPNFMVRN